jgi:hypothetical protein
MSDIETLVLATIECKSLVKILSDEEVSCILRTRYPSLTDAVERLRQRTLFEAGMA